VLPGVREALDQKNWDGAKREVRALEAALSRATKKLEEAAGE